MKTYNDITIEEYEMLLSFHRKFEFNQDELAGMYNFVRQYVNPHIPTCLSCHGNLREAKNMMMVYFNKYREQIEERLLKKQDEVIEPSPLIIITPILDEIDEKITQKEDKKKKK